MIIIMNNGNTRKLSCCQDGFRVENGVLVEYQTSATEVKLIEGITEIGQRAFLRAPHLKAVTLPKSLLVIGNYAFSQCTLLTSIDIPDGVETIGRAAFERCRGLTELTLPDSIKDIDVQAFTGCLGLKSIRLPRDIKSIGDHCFSSCTSLEEVHMGAKVERIGISAFGWCRALKEIHLPENVSSIDDGAFKSCEGLVRVDGCEGVAYIGKESFEGCENLESFGFSLRLRRVGDGAFFGCEKLKGSVPEGCHAGEQAFLGCKGLTRDDGFLILDGTLHEYDSKKTGSRITIPKSVRIIEGGVFGKEQVHITMNIKSPSWNNYGNITRARRPQGLLRIHGSTITFTDDIGKTVAKIYFSGYSRTRSNVIGRSSNDLIYRDGCFDFAIFDHVWFRSTDTDNKILTLIPRLMYPYRLASDYKEKFKEFIKKNGFRAAKLLIDLGLEEELDYLIKEKFIAKGSLTRLLSYTNENGCAWATAMLLNERGEIRSRPRWEL